MPRLNASLLIATAFVLAVPVGALWSKALAEASAQQEKAERRCIEEDSNSDFCRKLMNKGNKTNKAIGTSGKKLNAGPSKLITPQGNLLSNTGNGTVGTPGKHFNGTSVNTTSGPSTMHR